MAKDYREIFVKNLAYHMHQKHKKQADLVQDLGLNSSTVSSWCTGAKYPRMDKITLLADYLGIEPHVLTEAKTPESRADHSLTSKEKRLLAYFRLLNGPGQKKLIDHAGKLIDQGYTPA